jgi:hypothetical protein
MNTLKHFTLRSSLTLASMLLLLVPSPSQAGCGCDKPPPAPAAVIPDVAFGGMKISLFRKSFVKGQQWTVGFLQGAWKSLPRVAEVVLRRNLSDTTGRTITPRLIVTVPHDLPLGPTTIIVSRGATSFTIPATTFTVIGKPVKVQESLTQSTTVKYKTAVGADGVMYFGLVGLGQVCQPMKFKALLEGNPLRFRENGSIIIMNAQGFLIESLICTPAGCTPVTHYHPDSNSGEVTRSDRIEYWRHSFVQYCSDHLPGGAKDLDPRDRNWHKDGTPHVDYSTLIFAVTGHYDNGSTPTGGMKTFNLTVESDQDDMQGGWETEHAEEALTNPH